MDTTQEDLPATPESKRIRRRMQRNTTREITEEEKKLKNYLKNYKRKMTRLLLTINELLEGVKGTSIMVNIRRTCKSRKCDKMLSVLGCAPPNYQSSEHATKLMDTLFDNYDDVRQEDQHFDNLQWMKDQLKEINLYSTETGQKLPKKKLPLFAKKMMSINVRLEDFTLKTREPYIILFLFPDYETSTVEIMGMATCNCNPEFFKNQCVVDIYNHFQANFKEIYGDGPVDNVEFEGPNIFGDDDDVEKE